jgi:glucose dehydrogenase
MNTSKMSKIKIIIPSLTLMVLLVISASIVQVRAQSSSAASSAASANWLSGGNYPLNWNYNSQNLINASNVNNLQISWVFPIPAAPAQFMTGGAGSLPAEV